jgi:ATP-binding cassette subfamily C (CFTR/MRP) protein 1
VPPLFLIWALVGPDWLIPIQSELGRLDSLSSSPIYAHFSETLEGLDTIRAFRFQRLMKKENEDLIITNLRAYFCGTTSNR